MARHLPGRVYATTCVAVACFAFLTAFTHRETQAQQQNSQTRETPRAGFSSTAEQQNTSEGRFDACIREDFFAGIRGDSDRFDRAMKVAEDELAKNPKNAEARVWHGAGTYMLAKRWFRQGDIAKGSQLKRDGLQEMDDAVALERDNVAVLIPRAAILLAAAQHLPDAQEAKSAYQKSVEDYEKVLKLEAEYFPHLGEHPRGELLGALAEGWNGVGRQEKSRSYLMRITAELPGSPYAAKATALLANRAGSGPLGVTCLGCHAGATRNP